MSQQELINMLIAIGMDSPNKRAKFIAAVRYIGNPDPDAAAPPKSDEPATGFKLSSLSFRNSEGVDKRLVNCATLALTKYSEQDFCIFEGLRTLERQKQLLAKGTTKTLESKHIVGLALDLVPVINEVPAWDWEGCYKIAFAMDQAATELGIAKLITWGGAWDRKLSDFGGSQELYKKEVELYCARHPGKDFVDGPHFQIEKG